MAAMNLRDYAETAKIAAMVGGGGLLIYGLYRAGIFTLLSKTADAVGGAVDYVENVKGEDFTTPASRALNEQLNIGGLGLGSGGSFGVEYWFMNPSLMIPGLKSLVTADAVGVKATSAYIVIRARDFDSQWRMKDTAYLAAVKMHKDNKAILDKHVMSGGTLKTAFRNLVKTADFVVIYPDGSFKSA